MPCYSGGEDEYRRDAEERNQRTIKTLKKQVEHTEAMLCAVLSLLTPTTLKRIVSAIDTVESGVAPQEVFDWWTAHQEEDRIRREKEAAAHKLAEAREAEKKRKEQLTKSALSKLTPEERHALGVK